MCVHVGGRGGHEDKTLQWMLRSKPPVHLISTAHFSTFCHHHHHSAHHLSSRYQENSDWIHSSSVSTSVPRLPESAFISSTSHTNAGSGCVLRQGSYRLGAAASSPAQGDNPGDCERSVISTLSTLIPGASTQHWYSPTCKPQPVPGSHLTVSSWWHRLFN